MDFPKKGEEYKTPTGKNLVPRERTIRVNPNRKKQEGIPDKESPAIENLEVNLNGRQTELVLGCPQEFQQRSKQAPKEINSTAPAKAKSNPQEGISGDFHSQVRPERAPKGNKS